MERERGENEERESCLRTLPSESSCRAQMHEQKWGGMDVYIVMHVYIYAEIHPVFRCTEHFRFSQDMGRNARSLFLCLSLVSLCMGRILCL